MSHFFLFLFQADKYRESNYQRGDFLPLINRVEDAVLGCFKCLNQTYMHHDVASSHLQKLVSFTCHQ